MISPTLARNLVEHEDALVPTIFKTGQFNVIKKVNQNKKLTENEKRYLRGNIGKKINALCDLSAAGAKDDAFSIILSSIGSYYITGLEALKHNGYGWYYEPKVVEIINTKIEGKFALGNQAMKFIRVKSISNSKTLADKKTFLIYATNDQVMKDVAFTKNEYTRFLWEQFAKRYGKMFSDKSKLQKEEGVDFSKYLKWQK